MNASNPNSWSGKPEVNWQNKPETRDTNNLPTENWTMAQMISNTTNNDWLTKNNWVQMTEADDSQQKQPIPQSNQPSLKNSSSNFGLVSNGM